MQALLGLIAIVCVVLVWYYQNKARRGGGEAIRATIQRLMTRRDYDVHPADSVDDARLAASGLVVAIATMDAPLSQREIAALTTQAQAIFEVSEREALDILSFGRWVAAECETAEEAVEKLTRRIADLAGPDAGPDTLQMIQAVATADGNALGDDEAAALQIVRQVLDVS